MSISKGDAIGQKWLCNFQHVHLQKKKQRKKTIKQDPDLVGHAVRNKVT